MKKIIVFGAKGMLGSELVKTFSADDQYQVFKLDKEELDITKKRDVFGFIEKEQPEIMINAIAFNDVDGAENKEEFEMAKRLNGEVPGMLAQAAKNCDAVFVQYVTDYLFDGKKGEYTEDEKPNPISNYGFSKALGEKNVQEIGGKYYLVRISKLFGKSGTSPNAKKSFFSTMLDLSQDRDELKIVDDERSCFTYVPDLVAATKDLVEKKYEYGIYHLVNKGAVTWFEGARKLFELVNNKKIKIIPVSQDEFPRPAKRARSTVLLNTKFPQFRHYEEALKEWLETVK
ncbi:MAG: dTDP-4-dehydrorhamnose reductase [Patescibacteria group bacterium]|nr:dTDP-4-dehydrorhamnose reductase [Patescibacteria group bacterium]